jgi:hypothetical protein
MTAQVTFARTSQVWFFIQNPFWARGDLQFSILMISLKVLRFAFSSFRRKPESSLFKGL